MRRIAALSREMRSPSASFSRLSSSGLFNRPPSPDPERHPVPLRPARARWRSRIRSPRRAGGHYNAIHRDNSRTNHYSAPKIHPNFTLVVYYERVTPHRRGVRYGHARQHPASSVCSLRVRQQPLLRDRREDAMKKSLTMGRWIGAQNHKSPEPRAQSPEPRAQSPEPRAQSPEPRAQSPEPRAQSPEPRAQSPEPRAQSPEPRAQSPGPRAQSPEPRAQSPEPRAQSPEPRAQSPEPRAQSPEHLHG